METDKVVRASIAYLICMLFVIEGAMIDRIQTTQEPRHSRSGRQSQLQPQSQSQSQSQSQFSSFSSSNPISNGFPRHGRTTPQSAARSAASFHMSPQDSAAMDVCEGMKYQSGNGFGRTVIIIKLIIIIKRLLRLLEEILLKIVADISLIKISSPSRLSLTHRNKSGNS